MERGRFRDSIQNHNGNRSTLGLPVVRVLDYESLATQDFVRVYELEQFD